MRAVGLSLGLMASVSLAFATTPAFAQDNAPPGSAASPAVQDAKENKETAKEAAKEDAAKKAAETPKEAGVPADGKVTVHVEAAQQVTLERRQGAQAQWEHVCNSPCDEKMSVNDEYRIVGDGLNASKPFMLDAKGESVTLNVQPGFHKKYVTGTWVLAGGAVLGITGTVVIIAGASSNTTFSSDGLTHNSNTNWITAGAVLILGGVVAAITGGAMAIDNAHTGVNGGVATPPERKAPGNASVQLSASRLPTYREAEKVPEPAAFVVPVLHGTF